MAEERSGVLDFEDLPEKLYRYRSGNSEHLDKELKALRHGCVWLSELKRQNDPYEGRPIYRPAGLEAFLKEYDRLYGNVPAEERNERWVFDLRRPSPAVNEREFYDAVTNVHREFIAEATRNFKLACFSYDKPGNGSVKHGEELMWAHYAASFEGFRLEFTKRDCSDRGKPPKEAQFFKVEYRDDRHKIDQKVMLAADFEKALNKREQATDTVLQKLTAIKSKRWGYEQEVRLVNLGGETGYYRLPYYYLTGVTFGLRCKPETVWEVWSELGDGISYCHQRLSPDGFGFSYQRCEFPPRVCGSEA